MRPFRIYYSIVAVIAMIFIIVTHLRFCAHTPASPPLDLSFFALPAEPEIPPEENAYTYFKQAGKLA